MYFFKDISQKVRLQVDKRIRTRERVNYSKKSKSESCKERPVNASLLLVSNTTARGAAMSCTKIAHARLAFCARVFLPRISKEYVNAPRVRSKKGALKPCSKSVNGQQDLSIHHALSFL